MYKVLKKYQILQENIFSDSCLNFQGLMQKMLLDQTHDIQIGAQQVVACVKKVYNFRHNFVKQSNQLILCTYLQYNRPSPQHIDDQLKNKKLSRVTFITWFVYFISIWNDYFLIHVQCGAVTVQSIDCTVMAPHCTRGQALGCLLWT